MPSRTHTTWIVLAAVALALGCADPEPWGGRVRGQVTAVHGGVEVLLPNARLFIRQQPPGGELGKLSISSDEMGQYEMPVEPWWGDYELCASAPGFQTTCHPDPLPLAFSPGVDIVRDLALQPAGDAVRGRVMLEGETACSEIASVDLLVGGAAFSSTTTNRNGEYLLAVLPASDVVDFEVRCAGLQVATGHVLSADERSGAQAVDWLLPNTPPQIEGLVVSNADGPLRFVTPGDSVQIEATVSDPDGDPLVFSWWDDGDSVVSANAASIPWTAPGASQVDTLHLRVDDGRGGVSSARLTVRVGPAEDRFIGKVFDEASGAALVGASVDVDGQQTTTGDGGVFGLSVPAADFHVLQVRNPGYVPHVERMAAGAPGLEIRLPVLQTVSADPTQEIEVWDGSRGVSLKIPANSLETASGDPPVGLVDVGVHTRDDLSRGAMGSRAIVTGGQTETWKSVQSAVVEITDSAGTPVNLIPGREAVVGFQAPPGASPPPALQLARLDDVTGIWDDLGQAELIGSRYEAVVPHFSSWSTGSSDPNATACLRIEVNSGSLQLPARVRIYEQQFPLVSPLHFVGQFALYHELNAIYRLPPGHHLMVEVNPFTDPDVVLNTYFLSAGNGVSPVEPPYPYEPCKKLKIGVRVPAEKYQGSFRYLTRSGWGSEGAAQAYYQSIGAVPAKDNFAKWMAANGFTTADFANDVVFYNPNELGLTRRANCKSHAVNGVVHYSCYVTKYGSVGAPHVESLWDGVGGLFPGDTVAMEFSPAPGTGSQRIVKFYIYGPASDPSQQPLKTHTAFDTDGDQKYVPNVCMNCHGYYTPQFVVFDPHQYEYLGIGQNTLQNLQEPFRQLNRLVWIVHYFQTQNGIAYENNPAVQLIEDLYGSNNEIQTQGSTAGPGLHGDFEYDEITKPYCRTCHMWTGYDFEFGSNLKPSAWSVAESRICSGMMPNAMAPQLSLWSSASPFLPGYLGLSCLPLNDPPSVQITAPSDGASVGFGGLSFATYTATASDTEDGSPCCLIWWTSDEGSMGFGSPVDYVFATPGSHPVCATAWDSAGKKGQDCITVQAVNTPPVANIQVPVPNQVFYVGEPTSFWGEGYDPNEPYLQLPCSALSWTFPVGPTTTPPPTTGCQPVVTFLQAGLHTVQLEADDGNATDTDTVVVDVQNLPPGSPPGVNIDSPQHGGLYPPDDPLTLDATVTSHGGGPIVLQWSVDAGNGAINVSTSNPDTWVPSSTLPSDCGSQPVDVQLEATDGNGSNSDTRTIYVAWPPC